MQRTTHAPPTKFLGPLDAKTEDLIDVCNTLLTDPARLSALEKSQLMNTPNEEAFDRLAELAAKILKVPLTIVSLVSDTNQFFKAAYGLPSPYDELRTIPVDESVCRYTLSKEIIIAANAAENELLKHHPSVGPWGIVAFIAIPMIDHEGHVLGAFCAVDSNVREWSDEEIHLMKELTRSVMTEIYLRRQIAELKSERELRDRFVIALSHDLRNPLNVMKMAAEFLTEPDVTEDDRGTFIKMICTNADRADQMIQDLLDVNRMEAGHEIPPTLELVDFDEILKSIIQGLTQIHGNRFTLATNQVKVLGKCNASHLRRMVENLANNAVKYGAPGTPITISLGADSESVSVAIHNEGNPISPDALKKLFDLFQRSESAILSSQEGWGIGLTVVRSLAESMSGTVSAESSPEAGTTFRIALPL